MMTNVNTNNLCASKCSLNVAQSATMIALVSKREMFRIFVTPEAKTVVEDFAEKFDMTEKGVASRVYMWFSTLPLPVQKWVTGLADSSEGEGMKQFAESLANSVKPPPMKKVGKQFTRQENPSTTAPTSGTRKA